MNYHHPYLIKYSRIIKSQQIFLNLSSILRPNEENLISIIILYQRIILYSTINKHQRLSQYSIIYFYYFFFFNLKKAR